MSKSNGKKKEDHKKEREPFHARTEDSNPPTHSLCPANLSYDGTNRHSWYLFRFKMLLVFKSHWEDYPTGAHLHLTLMSTFTGAVRDYYLAIYHKKETIERTFSDWPQLKEAVDAVLDDVANVFGETDAETKRRYGKEYVELAQGAMEWDEFYRRFIHIAVRSGLISAPPDTANSTPNPTLFADLKRKTRIELVNLVHLHHGYDVNWETFVNSCRNVDAIVEPRPKQPVKPKREEETSAPLRGCTCFTVPSYDGSDSSEWDSFRAKVMTIFLVDWREYADVNSFSLFLGCIFEGHAFYSFKDNYELEQLPDKTFSEWPQLEAAANNIFDRIEKAIASRRIEAQRYEIEYSTMWQQGMDWRTFYSKFLLAAFKSRRISALPTAQEPNQFLFLDLKFKTKRELVDRVYIRHGVDVDWDKFVAACREFDAITH